MRALRNGPDRSTQLCRRPTADTEVREFTNRRRISGSRVSLRGLRLGREQGAPAVRVDPAIDKLAPIWGNEVQAHRTVLTLLRRLLVLHQFLGHLLLRVA